MNGPAIEAHGIGRVFESRKGFLHQEKVRTVALTYAVVVFHVPIAAGSEAGLALSIVLTAFAMVGFGLLLGGVALYLRTSIILGNIFLFIGLLFAGTNFPISELPAPLQVIGDGLPLTWGLSSIRASISGAPLGQLLVGWGILVVSIVVTIGGAMALWDFFERRALSTGSIARF
jgi:ABC-type polysaccharide/polyol phosphate export permease